MPIVQPGNLPSAQRIPSTDDIAVSEDGDTFRGDPILTFGLREGCGLFSCSTLDVVPKDST